MRSLRPRALALSPVIAALLAVSVTAESPVVAAPAAAKTRATAPEQTASDAGPRRARASTAAPSSRTAAPALRTAAPAFRTAAPALRTAAPSSRTAATADVDALALEISEAWMAKVPARSMAWNWVEAVLALGLEAVQEDTGSPEILSYVKTWIDYHMARGIRVNRNDAVVPATSALYLYETLGDPVYLEPVLQCNRYLEEEAPRLDDGAIAHTLITPNQVWIDSLFMFGTFYTMQGSILGEGAAFDAIAEQFGLFEGHLFSDRQQLYFHMYDEAIDQTVPSTPTFWGRGNGWALASLAMLLTDLPANHPDRPALEGYFRAHAAGILKWQDSSGLWWTVVNRPGESYLETSATALFTFGLERGYRLGLLGPEAHTAAEKGVAGIISRIEYDDAGYPVVTGISKATNPGPFSYYAHIPVTEDEPYGVGAVLLALKEWGRP